MQQIQFVSANTINSVGAFRLNRRHLPTRCYVFYIALTTFKTSLYIFYSPCLCLAFLGCFSYVVVLHLIYKYRVEHSFSNLWILGVLLHVLIRLTKINLVGSPFVFKIIRETVGKYLLLWNHVRDNDALYVFEDIMKNCVSQQQMSIIIYLEE